MRVAFDTNILVYAEGVNGAARQAEARGLIRRIPDADRAIPVQALGELYNVLVRKIGWQPDRARSAVSTWRNGNQIIPTTEETVIMAIDVATDHRLHIWDSIMLAVAARSGCHLLISEDLQDGFTWGGVTIANPFAATRHPLLQALLGE